MGRYRPLFPNRSGRLSQVVTQAGLVAAAACSSVPRPLSSARVSSNLLRSAKLIGLLTLASRILGLVRDITISSAFGVGTVSSAFWTAFQVPNLFRRLFGEGALSAA